MNPSDFRLLAEIVAIVVMMISLWLGTRRPGGLFDRQDGSGVTRLFEAAASQASDRLLGPAPAEPLREQAPLAPAADEPATTGRLRPRTVLRLRAAGMSLWLLAGGACAIRNVEDAKTEYRFATEGMTAT